MIANKNIFHSFVSVGAIPLFFLNNLRPYPCISDDYTIGELNPGDCILVYIG